MASPTNKHSVGKQDSSSRNRKKMCMIEKVSAERYVDDTLLNSIHLTKKQLSVSVFVYSLSMQTIFPGDINFQLVFVLTAFTMPLIVALKKDTLHTEKYFGCKKNIFLFSCFLLYCFCFCFLFYFLFIYFNFLFIFFH